MPELKTVWGENLNPDSILPEYPRPQLARNSYVNLNGRWDYAITASGAEPEHWDGEILVPFSPEAPLSGVNRTLLPGQTLWYRREIAEIRREGQRLLLHFGAIDQKAKIYVNGKLAGAHLGGYTAFTVELTEFLTYGPSVLTVAVSVWNTSLTESFGFNPEAVAENPGNASLAVIVALLAVIMTCPFVIVNT